MYKIQLELTNLFGLPTKKQQKDEKNKEKIEIFNKFQEISNIHDAVIFFNFKNVGDLQINKQESLLLVKQ